MKHKKDAIDHANEVIKLHSENGLTQKQSEIAAMTTVDFTQEVGVYPAYESLLKRTQNYLRFIVFGQETSDELHKLEQQVEKLHSKQYNSETASEYDNYQNKIDETYYKIDKILKIKK